MAKTHQSIFDIAFIRAGQNGTTVDTELRKMRERSAQTRRARAEARRWRANPKNAALPYID